MNDRQEVPNDKKKPNILVRLLAFLVTLALVFGAVTLVVYRDRLNLDALARWFEYRNLETSESGWFSLNELSELDLEKTTPEQLQMCFEARRAEHWETRLE